MRGRIHNDGCRFIDKPDKRRIIDGYIVALIALSFLILIHELEPFHSGKICGYQGSGIFNIYGAKTLFSEKG